MIEAILKKVYRDMILEKVCKTVSIVPIVPIVPESVKHYLKPTCGSGEIEDLSRSNNRFTFIATGFQVEMVVVTISNFCQIGFEI